LHHPKYFFTVLLSLFLFLASLGLSAHEDDLPWGDNPIIQIRCLEAKPGLVMLLLVFKNPLEHAEFNGRNYALLKWITANQNEHRINNLVRGTPGILPGFGFTIENFTLTRLLPRWAPDELEHLVAGINNVAGRAGVLDNQLRLAHGAENGATLIVMPYLPLLNLEEFVGLYGATQELVERVGDELRPAFARMDELGVIHGDLALRNVGVILNRHPPFAHAQEANEAITRVVLFDWGGRRARVAPGAPVPAIETLEHLERLLEARTGIRMRAPRLRLLPPAIELLDNQLITPLRLLAARGRNFGSPHETALPASPDNLVVNLEPHRPRAPRKKLCLCDAFDSGSM
jgi:hypothetical protein